MTDSLAKEIGSLDGHSVATLQSIYQRHCAQGDFVATILANIANIDPQQAASWLLKKHLEMGNSLSGDDCRTVIGVLPDQVHWESTLHLLQCLPYLQILEDDCDIVESFLNTCIKSENKFIRAWAYNGFNELALRFPRYRNEVDGMLARANESEAASVRARIRNILKSRTL